MFVKFTKDYLGCKTGEQVDVAPEDAKDLITKGFAEACSDDLITPIVAKAMESAFASFSDAINKTVDAVIKKHADAETDSLKTRVKKTFGADGDGDPNHCFADFLLCVRKGDVQRLADEYDAHPEEMGGDGVTKKAALNTVSGTQGGYTIPTEFLPKLLSAAAEKAIVRPRATVIPMHARSIQIPYLDITNVPAAGDTAYFGGVVARWTDEAANMNETEPTFRQLEIVANELSGYTLASNSFVADNAIGLEKLLHRLFGQCIAWTEDYNFFNGPGSGRPQGMLTSPAAIFVSRQTASKFQIQDAGTMLGKLLPGWDASSTCWVIHPTVIAQMVQMVSAAAGVGWLDNLRDKPAMSLLGLPVCISEKLQPLGTAKDVCLFDGQHYVIGDRAHVQIAYSEHYKFTNNQGTWRFVHRVGGQPWLRSAVTLADGASTVSPYVYLT